MDVSQIWVLQACADALAGVGTFMLGGAALLWAVSPRERS